VQNADKTGKAGDGGFIVQIRKKTVVAYFVYSDNNSLYITTPEVR
jgi:hypothetical protein